MRRWAASALLYACAAHAGADAFLVEPAQDVLTALGADADDARWPFADPERVDVHYAPIGLDGVRHGDLDAAAHAAGETLLATALSERGMAKVRDVRLLERDVAARETRWLRPLGLRDPGRYFFAFFGDPSPSDAWGFRYEGHHLSLNVTLVPGRAPATTPLFLGAQPRRVPVGLPSAGVAVLGDEERLLRTLYDALAPPEREAATLPYREDRGHMLGQVPRIDADAAIGLAWVRMTDEQRALVDALLEQFAGLWAEPIARARRADLAAARPALHFAFVAASDPAGAFYARLAGGGLLLEIDNTEDGDHVHAVWHQQHGDFGDDLLAHHLITVHGATLARSDGTGKLR
jgi:hypothetical protein